MKEWIIRGYAGMMAGIFLLIISGVYMIRGDPAFETAAVL